jgi:uncharacterized protein (TIGR00251 family)
MPDSPCHWRDSILICRLRIHPRGGRDEIVGRVGDRLKVRVTSPPVDGEANRALARYLAKRFAVPRTRVSIVAGQRGRDKVVEIDSPRKIPDEVRACMG